MADSRSIRVSLVVLVIDDFSGKPVKRSNVSVSIAGEKTPVEKEDGYYVFVNICAKKVTLTCRSSIYQPKTQEVDLEQRDDKEILTLRLLPAAEYPIPSGATCVAGQTQSGDRIFFWNEENKRYRLWCDYCAGSDNIVLYDPKETVLEGSTFWIRDIARNTKEYFRILQKVKQECKMDRSLSNGYKKADTVVLTVYEVTADQNGRFFWMMPKEQDNGSNLFYRTKDGQERSVALQSGKINTIVL